MSISRKQVTIASCMVAFSLLMYLVWWTVTVTKCLCTENNFFYSSQPDALRLTWFRHSNTTQRTIHEKRGYVLIRAVVWRIETGLRIKIYSTGGWMLIFLRHFDRSPYPKEARVFWQIEPCGKTTSLHQKPFALRDRGQMADYIAPDLYDPRVIFHNSRHATW